MTPTKSPGQRELAPRLCVPTLYHFGKTCLLLGLDPGEVRTGRAKTSEIRMASPMETGRKILDMLVENAEDFDLWRMGEELAEEVMGIVLARFFAWAEEELAAAEHAASYYAEKAGVMSLLKGRDASTSLERQLAFLPVRDYYHLALVMPLGQSIEYLMLRTIEDAVQNPEAYM